MNSFDSLSLNADMRKNLTDLKYLTMTEIQEKSIPLILDGEDIIAQAKTGSGKTAAFGIGLLHKLDVKRFRIQALVLCPTRELAEQVTAELRRLARFKHNIKLLCLTGGMPMRKQEHSLSHHAHIVVGTPGRILKLLQRETLLLDDVNTLVLDEADRMLDMGFIDEVEDIFRYAPKNTQKLCFSATFPDEIKKFSKSFLYKPVEVSVESIHDETIIKQHFFNTTKKDKLGNTLLLLKKFRPESVIVFCNTKDSCRRVVAELNKNDVHSLALHGDLEQKDRTEVLIRFSNGSSRVLVATDVAARGLDIDDLGAIINFELPFETETYIHRIGRTGRAGKEGLALSLLAPGEDFRLNEINNLMKLDFKPEDIDITKIEDCKLLDPEMVTISINGGRKNKISPGDLLGVLTANNGISGSDVGKIDRLDYLTFVAIKREVSEKAFKIIESEPIKGSRYRALIND
ncbi:MAG: ATP-dependent RNA helicase DbpA [Spirochaetaceae bacterium]